MLDRQKSQEQKEREAAEGKPRSEKKEEEEEMLHGAELFIATSGGLALDQVDILDRSCDLWTAHTEAKEKQEKDWKKETVIYRPHVMVQPQLAIKASITTHSLPALTPPVGDRN